MGDSGRKIKTEPGLCSPVNLLRNKDVYRLSILKVPCFEYTYGQKLVEMSLKKVGFSIML